MSENENEVLSTNDLIEQRRTKLAEWRQKGRAYPTDFRRDALAADLLQRYGDKTEPELEAQPVQVQVAGRMMLRRLMGKAVLRTSKICRSHSTLCATRRGDTGRLRRIQAMGFGRYYWCTRRVIKRRPVNCLLK